MQVEDNARSLEDVRPDLHIVHKSAWNSDVSSLGDSRMIPDNPVGMPPEAPIDLPSKQSSYHESSHGEDYLTGWEEIKDHGVTKAKITLYPGR